MDMETGAKIERSLKEISRDVAETNIRLQMMEDDNREYKEYTRKHYEKMDNAIKELNRNTKYILSEQEKAKIKQMNSDELYETMIDNINEMRNMISTLLDKEDKLYDVM